MSEITHEAESKIPFEKFMLSISILLVAFFVGLLMVSQHLARDYPAHIEFSETINFDTTFSLPVPHFLYHIIIAMLTYLTPLSAKFVSICLMTVSITALVYIIWKYIRIYNKTLSPFLLSFIVISSLIITPASILKFNAENPNFYYTYFHSTPYHSPTYLLARPFFLLMTLLSIKIFSESKISLRTNMLITILLVLGTLAKPNYLIAFLPAIVLLAGWYLYRKQAVQWRSLIFSIIIPSVLLLTWQFSFTYIFDNVGQPTSIIVKPLAVFLIYVESASLNNFDIVLNLFLTILFPLILFILYPKSRSDKLFILSWLIFLVAIFQGYLLAETGERLRAGNFLWGGHFAVFVLYIASIITIIRLNLYQKIDWRFVLLNLIFLSHLLSGILWFYYNWRMSFSNLYW